MLEVKVIVPFNNSVTQLDSRMENNESSVIDIVISFNVSTLDSYKTIYKRRLQDKLIIGERSVEGEYKHNNLAIHEAMGIRIRFQNVNLRTRNILNQPRKST